MPLFCPRYWYDANIEILSARVFFAGREAKARGVEPKPVIRPLTAYPGTARPDLSNSVQLAGGNQQSNRLDDSQIRISPMFIVV
jgi:hypothetical protein